MSLTIIIITPSPSLTHSLTRRYRGYVKKGVKDGYGTFVFNNGETFEGFFVDGEMHEGRFRSNCGSVYEGQILWGKMHGKGIFRFSNGDIYQGDFCHSQRHGSGVFLSLNSGNTERYEGQFYQNMKHGLGTVYMCAPHRHVYVPLSLSPPYLLCSFTLSFSPIISHAMP
jgi:hypothetical protein